MRGEVTHPASPPVGHGVEKMPRLRGRVLLESVTLYVGTGGAALRVGERASLRITAAQSETMKTR